MRVRLSRTRVSPNRSQNPLLFGLSYDVDKRNILFLAKLDQHLAQVRCSGGVDEGGVAVSPHRLDHSKCGERIDERGCPYACWRVFGQGKT